MEGQLMKEMLILLAKGNCKDWEPIPIDVDFVSKRPFQLYVGGEGSITVVKEDGIEVTDFWVAGYHPITIKQVKVAGITASSLRACYFPI